MPVVRAALIRIKFCGSTGEIEGYGEKLSLTDPLVHGLDAEEVTGLTGAVHNGAEDIDARDRNGRCAMGRSGDGDDIKIWEYSEMIL